GRFIINYSMSFRGICDSAFEVIGSQTVENCDPNTVAFIPDAGQRAAWAELWKKESIDDWDRFLVTPAGGNFRADPTEHFNPEGFASSIFPGLGIARYASVFTIVTDPDPLFGFMEDDSLWLPAVPDPPLEADPLLASRVRTQVAIDGLDQAPAAGNVLISGSTSQGDTFSDLIESPFSNVGPDVSAVGEGIATMGATENGTSFSAPQVAGLASYLWLLSGDLRNNEPSSVTRQAILDNARVLPLAGRVIDAYAAVLSLDAAALPTPTDAPVRLAILDLNDDGVFDETDISTFLSIYLDSNGDPVNPSVRDYLRFDLNGDGFSGGSHTEMFDLDRVGSTQYGQTQYSTVTQSIEGQDVTYDESAVTDLDVLCYNAYSDLYTGDPNTRDDELAARCQGSPAVSVTYALAGAHIDLTGQSCSGCTIDAFEDEVIDEDSPGRDVSAVYPSRSVSGSDPNSGSTYTATGSASANGDISHGAGGSITFTGTGSADGSAVVTGDGQAGANAFAQTQFQFTTQATCAFTVEVTFNASGTNTSLKFLMPGANVDFEDTDGSASGTLSPGSYVFQATALELAAAGNTPLSDFEHAGYSFTVTLTPQ
ncbi:MAG TPA: hypothetical protein VNI57_02335, partial [Candidatus Saccharimonadales bacterium]|nr:hypothetical protein [Candidatus Saccharimonadales bacterium]